MRFTNIITLAAALLAGAVSAAPAPTTTGALQTSTDTPPVSPEPDPTTPDGPWVTMPTAEEVATAFREVMPDSSALFFTGGTYDSAKLFQEASLAANPPHEYLTLKDAWVRNKAGYNEQYWTNINDHDTLDPELLDYQYQIVCSKAFAMAASGDVVLTSVTPWGDALASVSFWTRYELPEVKKNMKSGQVRSLTTRYYTWNTMEYLEGKDTVERA